VNLGVFVCIQCSGAHRNLGTHISKIRSSRFDEIEPAQIEVIKQIGNARANRYWEHSLPLNLKKPVPQDTLNVKTNYVKRKYFEKAYVDKSGVDVELLRIYSSVNK
jgi:stromal membrane-associated protein